MDHVEGHVPAKRQQALRTFVALVQRDLLVLRKRWLEFTSRTLLQPLLLLFVFTYLFPTIGQSVGNQTEFTGSLVAGVLAVTIVVQGIQAVSLPMVHEFGHTREIEDRVLAPLPLAAVALVKVLSGSLQCFLAGALVLPMATIVPLEPVVWRVHWLLLLSLLPLICVMAAALGLVFGTAFQPRTVPVLFGLIVVPLSFLGCVYYSWTTLRVVPWLQTLVLCNPLVYVSEGLRAALTGQPHMALVAVFAALLLFTVVFLLLGIRGFKARVLS
jgi:ABC-2 type transport system permease protein